MNVKMDCDDQCTFNVELRSHSAQASVTSFTSPQMKIPMPPRLWITDISDDSSDDNKHMPREDGACSVDRHKVRSRYRIKHKIPSNIPMGIFWDIENCQVPRGCSAIDVVAAIRAKFLVGRREVDFVVVCDVRKETPLRLQELNDSQISLIHVCGTQKNAADEKLRQCMRRFGELHTPPAALVLISGDINFAGDLCDFRYRKNVEVILVHKQNTSSALITCATSHYNFNDITDNLPRHVKNSSQSEPEDMSCELEIGNLPLNHAPERVSRRLKRLADNCGGKVLRVTLPTALLRFPTPDHTSRALKRMDGEDVFGRKISTRQVRGNHAPAYSSDEGYSTAPAAAPPPQTDAAAASASREWALALQQLPLVAPSALLPPPKPRKIRGTHGSAYFNQSTSSINSADDSKHFRETSSCRAISPWNSSGSFSEQSSDGDSESLAELTVTNLPNLEPTRLHDMLIRLFSQYMPVVKVMIWTAGEGPTATIVLRSEWDARLAIARIHKRRLESYWTGRRLELSLGTPSPVLNLDILRTRLKAILLDQQNYMLPLLRLRDAYASRHCCALTTSDIAKVKDTVIIHENFGRMVQLIDLTPPSNLHGEEMLWKCNIHGVMNAGQEDGSRILAPIFIELSVLSHNVQILLHNHGGILPLLSFVDCYEATFAPLVVNDESGVALELLLRSIPGVELRDSPSRHITWCPQRIEIPSPNSQNSDGDRSSRERERPRTSPCLEPLLTLFERELVDLIKTAPRCTIAFSKLIPAFHHHFGRQCRVADYGFTKLPDLLAALSNTILVLGSGSSRVITLSPAAQSRRWTSDLVKMLKAQLGRAVFVPQIPHLYQFTFDKKFLPADYGVCTLPELMRRAAPRAASVGADGAVALPRHAPSDQERARTLHFSVEALELLCHTPNLRMEFSRFVPAYHAHFGRQLRVSRYGCSKLYELFELIPDAVAVKTLASGERVVRMAPRPARAVVAQRLAAVAPVALGALPAAYALRFGAAPLPDALDADSIEALVFAAGGHVEGRLVRGPGGAPRWASAALAACAALSADRSVAARGSTEEYFVEAFERRFGCAPEVRHLKSSGVITSVDGRVRLTAVWRLVWRIALLLSSSSVPLTPMEIFNEYSDKYEPVLPLEEIGFKSVLEFVRYYREVFAEYESQKFSLCPGVVVPRANELTRPLEDFSVHDTPPGQKGSRVFDSPNANIWCSPPASDLPSPTAFLAQDSKRRTRLAAQFNSS